MRPLRLVVQKVNALVSANSGLTVQLLNQSNAKGELTDATSILGLLMLCANAGHSILIRVTAALREVAEAIGMHESTVSRVTNEKYAQTPRGVLPLKYFFSSALKSTDGEDVSARGIRATIEKLVAEEDPQSPLTDQALVELLERDGVKIARRTVAKYRDQLRVLPARMRKRL